MHNKQLFDEAFPGQLHPATRQATLDAAYQLQPGEHKMRASAADYLRRHPSDPQMHGLRRDRAWQKMTDEQRNAAWKQVCKVQSVARKYDPVVKCEWDAEKKAKREKACGLAMKVTAHVAAATLVCPCVRYHPPCPCSLSLGLADVFVGSTFGWWLCKDEACGAGGPGGPGAGVGAGAGGGC